MKGMGNLGGMMKQMQNQAVDMQKKMGEIQESLKERVIETSSGGGMVTVHVNGRQDLLSVKIDKEVIDPDDVQMLEDLILAAVSQGMKKSQEMYQEEMNKLTGGMNMPGLSGLLQ